MLVDIIILSVLALLIIGFLIYSIFSGNLKESGSTTTILMGATSDLMSKEQKKAAEVIVEQKAGKKMEEQKSGELAD